jgi:hypothetical protein
LLIQDWAKELLAETSDPRYRYRLRVKSSIPIIVDLTRQALAASEHGTEPNHLQHEEKTAHLAMLPQTAAEKGRVQAIYQAASALGVARLSYRELAQLALGATRNEGTRMRLSQRLDGSHGLFYMPPKLSSDFPSGAIAVQDKFLGTMAETRTVIHEFAHAVAHNLGFVVQALYADSIYALIADEMIADLTAGIISQAIGSEVAAEIKGIVSNYIGGGLAQASSQYRGFMPNDHYYRGKFLTLALTTTLAVSEEMSSIICEATDTMLSLPG